MGKTLNHMKEGKQSMIYKYAIDHANKDELKEIEKYYGNPSVTKEESKKIAELFDMLGAKKSAEELVKEYTDRGIEIINDMDVSNKDEFITFADYLLNREN